MENIKKNADGTAELLATDQSFLNKVKTEAARAARELLDTATLRAGDILVVGCSTSEVAGHTIGKASIPAVAEALLAGLYPVVRERGVFLAAQCCEHLNRALIMEAACAEKYGLDVVSVRPAPKAGGSFATAVFNALEQPVAVETVRAHAGIDIGGTLIGMHLRAVAVPVRLTLDKIGEANILCARTRPKYIGGPRAVYE
ncbi:MAG: TIGR01440 family protein [Ruminococcaceae bacterium]|nr:TIGR01440 family protein [Oscillospiraceae bacterium]